MKQVCTFILLLWCFTVVWGQDSHEYKVIAPDRIESKNYYFTFLLGHFQDVDSLLQTNGALIRLAKRKQEKLSSARTMEEQLAAFKFSDEEIKDAGEALESLYKPENPLGRLLMTQILPSGCYKQYVEKGGALLRKIWEQDAKGMNYAIDVYGGAVRPNYPDIDSIYFDVTSRSYQKEILPGCLQNVLLENKEMPRFYSVSLSAVRNLLDVNGRLQAADFEPMGTCVNKAAYRKIKNTVWSGYPYSAILVLGAGPDVRGEAISPESKIRAAYSAVCYQRHLVPFIIVSGGKVHPYHTPFCEAEQMKRYLMDVWHIPEEAVIMEPHARHTTTNVRNAGRILWREGFPVNKPALITSSLSHIDYVLSDRFKKRFLKELKTVPFRLGKRIADRLVEFYPNENTLIINPYEPLDP